MSEATDSAVEAKEKSRAVALVIAILALLLALAEAGAKNAQHLSTEKNIRSSDLFNFCQAKRDSLHGRGNGRGFAGSAEKRGDRSQSARVLEKQSPTSKRRSRDTKKTRRSLKTAWRRSRIAPRRPSRLANRRLGHYELGSGLDQIAIVLASAAIITEITALVWLSVGRGAIGAALPWLFRADGVDVHRLDVRDRRAIGV